MTHRWALSGSSMYPFGTGWTAEVAPGPVQRGDFVVYLDAQGRTIGHRLHGVADGWLYVRGDTVGPEPPVPASALIGRVVALERGPLRLVVPRDGAIGALWRRLGLGWAAVARRYVTERARWRRDRVKV